MIIGISGAIGSGKSTAAKYLSNKYMIPLYEADKYGHKLYNIFSPVFYQILKSFRTVNRKKIAEIVFNNPKKLKILNNITHPAIFKMISKDLQSPAIIEATLLHQIGLDLLTDLNILITTNDNNIRLQARGYSQKQINQRKVAMPKFNLKNFDIVIENNGNLEQFYQKLDNKLAKYLRK